MAILDKDIALTPLSRKKILASGGEDREKLRTTPTIRIVRPAHSDNPKRRPPEPETIPVTVSMVPCPHCGTPQSPNVQQCSACGGSLGVAPPPAPPASDLAKTQLTGSVPTTQDMPPVPAAAASTSGTASGGPVSGGGAASGTASGGTFKKTMLGMPNFAMPASGPGAPATGPAPASSALPMSAPVAGPASAANTGSLGTAAPHEPQPPVPRPLNKTRLGVGPIGGPPARPLQASVPDAGAQPPGAPVPDAQATGAGAATAQPAEPEGGFKRTMLGVAPPEMLNQLSGKHGMTLPLDPPSAGKDPRPAGVGETQMQFSPLPAATGLPKAFNPAGTLPLAKDGSIPLPPVNPVPVTDSHQKTVLGVAVPGIAPIRPGQPKAPPPEPVLPAPALYPAPEPAPPAPGPRRLLYGVFVGAFLGLVIASVAAFYFLSSPFSVEAKVVLDAQGDEHLQVICAECPDGTTSEINGQMTKFSGGKALVTLADPLKVGNNSLSISLLKPGDNQAETLDLTVPVDFRIKGDLSGLRNDPPTARVTIQAIPGTTAILDGGAVALDAGGAGQHVIDVSRDLTGESGTTTTFERKVPYAITPPNASAERGEVTMRASITPLTLDAPGPSIVIDSANFMLAGRTSKGGSVSVAGRAITVDPQGRFAQLMSVSSAGETTIVVRASSQDHAPRLVPVRIRRVESLAQETQRLKGESRTPYASFGTAADKNKGQSVLFDAVVVETRTDSHTTVLLLNVTSGCGGGNCLARVIYGARLSLKKDQAVTVSGTLAGAVDGPRAGTQIPELRADLVVRKTP